MSGSDDGYEENKTDSRHRKEEVSYYIHAMIRDGLPEDGTFGQRSK